MSYNKTTFHKKVMDSANGMNNSFYLYMINNEKPSYSYNIAYILDYFIFLNNILHRRGSKKKKIDDVLKFATSKDTYKNINNFFKKLKRTSDTKDYIDDYLIEQCYIVLFECQNITDDTFEYIVNKVNIIINYLDSIKFDWKVDGNIIYDKNPYTRTIRTYSLSINENKDYELFKKKYRELIYVDDNQFEQLVELCFDYYVTLENTINCLVRKEYDEALYTLEDYLNNSKDMKKNTDIYVKSNYMKLFNVLDYLKSQYYTKANQELRIIIESENYKFRKLKFELFKLLQVNMKNESYQLSLDVAKRNYIKETNILHEELDKYSSDDSPCCKVNKEKSQNLIDKINFIINDYIEEDNKKDMDELLKKMSETLKTYKKI